MYFKLYVCTILFILTRLCSTGQTLHSISKASDAALAPDTFVWIDHARNRMIPVAIYRNSGTIKHKQVVIVSHGYGQNEAGSYLQYSYITDYLARQNYFVVSVQHELGTDSLLPMTGIPQVTRRPFWERGADNLLFVISYLKKSYPELDFGHITLIGHSNGGDMTALFPQKYPGIVARIITLDNRRMKLPRTLKPSVYSIRSSDQPADDLVLPTEDEQKKFRMTIVKLSNTIHNDMDDDANPEQRLEINELILKFMKDR